MSETIEILVSYDYGAGWATWSEKPKEVAEYKPIIEFLNNGGDRKDLMNEDHPLIIQMKNDLDLEYFFTGGARDLEVVLTTTPYRIDEYDGKESVKTTDDFY